MARTTFAGWSLGGLRLALAAFFVALALPSAVLVYEAYGQLRWEAFYQHRLQAEALAARIARGFEAFADAEEARTVADYRFLVLAGEPAANFVQRSELSRYPVKGAAPGVLGHFQVDPDGRFSTPLLPVGPEPVEGFGIGGEDGAARRALEARIHRILSDNRLVGRDRRPPARVPAVDEVAKLRDPAEQGAASLASEGDAVVRNAPATAGETAEAMRPRVASVERAFESTLSGNVARENEVATQQRAVVRADLEEAERRAAEVAHGAAAESEMANAGRSKAEAERSKNAALDEKGQASRERKKKSIVAELQALSKQMPSRSAPAPADQEASAQSAFDRLATAPLSEGLASGAARSLGRVEDLNLATPYADAPALQQKLSEDKDAAGLRSQPRKRVARKEQSAVIALQQGVGSITDADVATPGKADARQRLTVTTFETDLDPFELSRLDSGHFVLFRKVWRDGARIIQGVLLDAAALIDGLAVGAFRETALARTTDLAVAYRGEVITAVSGARGRDYLDSASSLGGSLLYRTRLGAPFGDVELIFSVNRLPVGPGGRVILWAGAILGLVLLVGSVLMYRLGARQIALGRQQQDFVAAVSHELKTPLTSIRMYGEMLREGWVSEEKKRTYYDYIFAESERLSRLINNVLQLARMTRNEIAVDLVPVAVGELVDELSSKVSTQVEQAGFGLGIEVDPRVESATVRVDRDGFSQVAINIVDNALKFSARADVKRVEITVRAGAANTVEFAFRDHGPGVPRDQLKKIFRLFYRSGAELTRETVGTGIGLALVHQLVRSMGGEVDAVNRDPGAEFLVRVPRA